MNRLLSVGIDVGTSTTQVIFSRLTVQNDAGLFQVPSYSIADKEILYQSPIAFTPLRSETEIDAEAVRKIVDREYAAAGIEKSEVDTGAIIITGETARKENAAAVLHSLSGYAGDFVVATAGPALESVLAARGSGAAEWSEQHHCAVLNLDIGGGTTNFALFDGGELLDTGCLNVGGRLMKFDAEGNCTYLSHVLRPFFNASSPPQEVCDFLVGVLEEAVGLREEKYCRHFVTDKLCKPAPKICFSGGVADLIDDSPRDAFAYGDLGVLLGRTIYRSPLFPLAVPAKQTIRATVIGAGCHTVELSGSTVFYDDAPFPLKNLPVICLNEAESQMEPSELATIIQRKLSLHPDEATVLWLKGMQSPRFSELCKLTEGIAEGLKSCKHEPLVVAVHCDMGKALGQAIRAHLPQKPLICLDGIRLSEGAFLDIAPPIADGRVLPVVVKTLVL